MTSPPVNSNPQPTPPQRLRQWIIANPFLLVAIIYLLGNGLQFAFSRQDSSEWDQVFVRAARQLIGKGDIYAAPVVTSTRPSPELFQLLHPFTYPPFQAILAIPFTFLPPLLSRICWFLVQVAALTTLWQVSWRISGGRRLNRGRWTPAEAAICVLGLSAGMRYVQGVFGHQQTDILIDALLVGGCFAWQNRRDILAASAWGVAAAFKGPPLLLAPYLAWRGRWFAAAWTIILAIALNVLPDAIHRAPHGIWLTQWYTRIVKPTSGDVGAWYVDVTINQSIAGAAHRFFTTGWSIANGQLNISYNKKILPPKVLKLLVYALEIALLAAAAWAMGRPFRRPSDARIAGLEFALVMLLMLLLSPMSHKTHFGILILPGFFVARMAIEHHDRIAAWCMLACVIVIGLLDHFFFYTALGDMFAWYGNVMWGTIALGVACFHSLAVQSK
ncbi:MAG: glycosyltransferase family 87 protein [Tepidisphaeraceae bacterium]